ncbi:Chloroperoxidase [Mycena sp. CBHHK59/15]|nr:Chloroperoxidase [Mycena sp. CBHHK59/15]
MKTTTLFSILPLALAFPSFDRAQKRTPTLPPGDSTAALIDVSGMHAFVPPDLESGDIRGPCPALNALANHNYLPHNGIMTLAEASAVPNIVWGFGPDIEAIAVGLAMYGSDGARISIGGQPSSVLDGHLLDAQGLSGTHNQFESDSSPTRGDYYQFCGNNYDIQEPFFEELLNSYNTSGIYGLRIRRWEQSVQGNPYFFYGPIEMVVSTLVHFFISGILANFSPSHSDGFFDREGLQSLFGFTSDAKGKLKYNRGFERIPENWYRRRTDYTHADVAQQLEVLGQKAPKVLMPGGNMGKVNTFTPMNMSDLTYGVYTEQNLFEGNNLRCFCFQVLQLATPTQTTGEVLLLPGSIIESALDEWICPKLERLNEKMYDKYPGYKTRRL